MIFLKKNSKSNLIVDHINVKKWNSIPLALIINRKFSFCKIISFLFLFIFNFQLSVQSQNIALNRKYQLSEKPNYPNSAPSSDIISLTDGKYTTERSFWNQATTVGWQNKDVLITIDLDSICLIGSIIFSSFRAVDAGVYYPENIFVFTSTDNLKHKFIGDAADVLDNISGGLQPKEFSIKNINDSARFVTLNVIAKGSFIFSDEIQVFRGKIAKKANYPMVDKSLKEYVDSLKTPILSRRKLDRIKGDVENSLKTTNRYQNDEFAEIGNQISQANTQSNLEIVKDNLGKIKASNLNSKFNEPFILEYFNNWAEFNQSRDPVKNENNLSFTCSILINGVQYKSFLLTNSSQTEQTFTFKVNSTDKYSIELYNVAFVPTTYFENVADPLIKVTESIDIEPGESRMFLLKMSGIKTGVESSSIMISSKLKTSTINLECEIYNIIPSPQNNEGLNVNVWAYFNNPMLRGIENNVAKDLQSHYVNTFVIPPARLPDLLMNGEEIFVEYLRNFPTSEKVLLYMDYSNPMRSNGYKGGLFMSSKWKVNFINWYNRIKLLVLNSNFSNAEIYLYPYDEIKDENINDFKRLIKWAKNEIPDIKFYATLGTKANIDSLLPLLDIAQIHTSYTEIGQLTVGKPEIWTYNGFTPSRELSPYSFYRLMSWDAFLNGYKGIGFWNYADERNGNKLNLPNVGNYNRSGSYSVIYNDTSGNIISSRRWEAFRLGVEDYSLLQAYAKKFGDKKGKELAEQVVNNPSKLDMADKIRDTIIKNLVE